MKIKWIIDQNVRPNTIKVLQENLGKTFFYINHNNIFLNPSPRVMEIKTKINKWDLIKINSFCTTKETIKMKIQPSERGEIFVFNPNHTEKFKADI